MTHHDLVDRVAELMHERPGELRAAGITDELNLQGWLSARNLRLVAADPREPEVSPGFWIAEHHDGRCVVMFDESPYAVSEPVDVSPDELRRALVLVPLDPTRPSGSPPRQPVGATGAVEALLTAAHAEDAMQTHRGVELHAGRGIVGDRYFDGAGTFASGRPGSALTLVDADVLDELAAQRGGPVDHRRNVVVRGTDLNALVGRDFMLGEVRCRGRRLCEPCAHLDRLNGGGILRPLVHRGGLRADIVSEGTIRVGDALTPV